MADSNDSTSLSSVTRRRLLAGTMTTTAAWAFNSSNVSAWINAGVPDVALSLWRVWKAALIDTMSLCRRQQRLEVRLVETVGFPRAEIDLPAEAVTITVRSFEEIEELCGSAPSMAALRASAESALAAHQARWDAADAKIGYSAARRDELAAADRAQEIFDALMSTRSTTLAGVAGKLDAVLLQGETSDECSEFPWPQIRSALDDLLRIGQALQPGVFMPVSEANKPHSAVHRDTASSSGIVNT